MNSPIQNTSLSKVILSHTPKEVALSISMMSADERTLLYSLAKNHFTGAGKIVDAGIFLGASTLAFGAGVRDGETVNVEKPIISYDMAVVSEGMMDFFQRKNLHPNLQLYDDIKPIILENTKNYCDLISFRFGDICEESWDGGPIEICFLDVLKTLEVNHHCLRMFFPHLMEGAYLVQQDYFFHHLPYIKIYQEYLSDHFEYLGMVNNSGVFRCIKAPAEIPDLYHTLSHDDLLDLHAKAEARSSENTMREFLCRLSRVELFSELKRVDDMTSELENIKRDYRELLAESNHARRTLDTFITELYAQVF